MGLDIYNSLFGKESYVLQKFHEKKAQIKTTYNAQGNKVISKYSRSGRLVYTKTFVDNTIRLEQYGEIEKDVFGRDTRKAKVTVYGADGVTTLSTEELIQTLGKHGELLEETNTLTGEITKYTYDENGNLIEKREYGSNGKLKHAYDKNGKEIYINDPYSNETDVAKNQFGKETKSEYDYMGNPVSTITTKNFGEYTEKTYEYYSSYETKKDGTTTRTCKRGSAWIRSDEKTYTPVEYTAYVQVLDGNNNVIKETNKADGSYVEFSYNNKGNVKQKVYYDKSGNLLYTEKINYFEKSLEEITKIDSDGNVTEKRVYSSATNRVNYWEAYKNYSTNS